MEVCIMKMVPSPALWLVAVLLSVGCSATGPIYTQPVLPSEGDLGVVEVYRPNAFMAWGIWYRVFIDDEKVVTLSNNGYSRIEVPAGPHKLSIGVFSPPLWIALVFASDLPFQVTARERTCLCIEPGFFTAYPHVDSSNGILTAHFESPERDTL